MAEDAKGSPVGDRAEDEEEPEDGDVDSGGLQSGFPPKVEAWRRRSATGAILTGFAMGLQQVFEAERKQPAIIMETSGDPPSDLPVEAEVEGLRPHESVVSIRPWLLPASDVGHEADSEVDREVDAEVPPGDGDA